MPQEHVPLAPQTTMGVGGLARFFVQARQESDVVQAAEWARRHQARLHVLGSGSNVVVADEGVAGLVVKIAVRGRTETVEAGRMEVTAAAGEPWDDLVRHAVERGWGGIECLSGIPGLVGATPIQNVGAYGQQVSDVIVAVRALDTATGRVATFEPGACGFGYRDSRFKSGEPGRHVVLSVRYRLAPGAPPCLAYADVARDIEARGLRAPSLGDVRRSVLAIRRAKSMVLEAGDPNARSCGSFFLNPLVAPDQAARVADRLGAPGMPRWAEADGRVKLSAAWLIEHAGFARGTREGPVGLSSRHALAVVAHDDARGADVIAFARRVRDAVLRQSGVRLTVEPALWGWTEL